jgi:hypothetical protein
MLEQSNAYSEVAYHFFADNAVEEEARTELAHVRGNRLQKFTALTKSPRRSRCLNGRWNTARNSEAVIGVACFRRSARLSRHHPRTCRRITDAAVDCADNGRVKGSDRSGACHRARCEIGSKSRDASMSVSMPMSGLYSAEARPQNPTHCCRMGCARCFVHTILGVV